MSAPQPSAFPSGIVAFVKRDGPTCEIVAPFLATLDGAVKQATALGADPASVYVPHPVQDRSDEEIRELADLAFDRVVDRLVGG